MYPLNGFYLDLRRYTNKLIIIIYFFITRALIITHRVDEEVASQHRADAKERVTEDGVNDPQDAARGCGLAHQTEHDRRHVSRRLVVDEQQTLVSVTRTDVLSNLAHYKTTEM